MINNRRDNKFPIIRLPFLAIEEIFKTMHPIEIINFLMTSKRAKATTKNMTFYSKYAIGLGIDETMGIAILGTNNLEQMEEKTAENDGNILRSVFKYLKDPVEEWKHVCKYVLDIFKKQTIDTLTLYMDEFVDQNVSIIDFLRTNVKSVNGCNVLQSEEENDVDEHGAYLLANITVANELNSHLQYK
ncbi:hypothetical protein CRE_19512 [Caenorhabditis remanei]|uniref:F-box domain-containing protein n=1 Tax=Caenorhabditis remanei TaxID=31234 RepID=E3NI04_CAERE|nr:hypothetical protein CRE_19512 [Caenorhabditis remanei]